MKALPPDTGTVAAETGEAVGVAREMAKAYRRTVEFHRVQDGLSATDAEERANVQASGPYLDRLRNCPAEDVSWGTLERLGTADGMQAVQDKWRETKAAARDELRSGTRAAEAAEWNGATPWTRARFLALRDAFAEEWQPRGGMEWALVDMLAQAYSGWEAHLGTAVGRAIYECAHIHEQGEECGRWRTVGNIPDDAAALERAERFQRMFVRALRTLRDLRRYAPAITINQPRAVNIAADGGQQVNVTAGERE